MSRLRLIIRGAFSNWVSYAVTFLVAFFLSPFIVHHLGNVAYGVWVLVVSLISYLGLLDLGLRGAVTRYVAQHHAQNDHIESSRVVFGALWIRFWISCGILALSTILAFGLPKILEIPVELVLPARWALLLIGANLAMTLSFGVFGAVLAALHRFDLLSAVSIGQSLGRAAGAVILLRAGHGIVALASWELSVGVAVCLATAALSLRTYPELRISLGRPGPALLKKLWSYSFYAFLLNTAVQVVYYTDNLVVGSFVSVAAVTFYAIGGSIIEYLRQLVSSLTVSFTPLASRIDAEGQRDHMKSLLIHGTRASLLIALPIEATLFFRGPTFIGLWMGEHYAAASGHVLQVLLIAQVFALANMTSGGIAYGMAKHKPVAIWACLEGAGNLALSMLLAHKIGIMGVAWGTVIPSLAIHLFVWPPYVCKLVGMPVWGYVFRAWLQPILAVLPFAGGCYLAEHYWMASGLIPFFAQIAALMPLFIAGVLLCFSSEVATLFKRRSMLFLKKNVDAPPGHIE